VVGLRELVAVVIFLIVFWLIYSLPKSSAVEGKAKNLFFDCLELVFGGHKQRGFY
jgi:hypothetical protein